MPGSLMRTCPIQCHPTDLADNAMTLQQIERTVTSGISNTPVLLMGGIGNRLFQLARAVDLQISGRNPFLVECESVVGLSALTTRLLGWTTHPMWLDLKYIAAQLGIAFRPPSVTEQALLYAELARVRALRQPQRLNLPLSEDCRLAQIGYFQGASNMSRAALHLVVTQLDKVLAAGDGGPEQVLHIRGGDFAETDRVRAEDVMSFLQQSSGEAVCVTNDPGYVQTRYPDLPIYQSRSALEDFTAIARARRIFPSNSTFCFWACAVAAETSNAAIEPGNRDPYWQAIA